MKKEIRDKLLRVSELEECRDALKTTINTTEDTENPGRRGTRLGSGRKLRTAEGDLKTARTEYRAVLEADVENPPRHQ